MSAQRVKTNFNAIENAANQRDQDRVTLATTTDPQQVQRQEDAEKQM